MEGTKDADKKPSRKIDEILKEQERLEQILHDEFKKEITILFTDICGYTRYTEMRGDISSRAMLQHHNEIVLPQIEKNNGVVIKMIGDAVMATFQVPLDAVKAAIDIQKLLQAYNATKGTSDHINVKIGINTGTALVDENDIFGDAVNVAARIQSQAGKKEILISGELYNRICQNDDILCRFHDSVMVKGKAEPMKLYRVAWSDDDVVVSADPQVRSRQSETRKKKRQPIDVFHLEVTCDNNLLKIGAHEQLAGETSTVRHYEEVAIDLESIGSRCRDLVEILNKANRKGRISNDILIKLRESGQLLTDKLFTPKVKEKLNGTRAGHLVVTIDDQLVQIPWELLHDGKQFICQRFSMGRLVKTRQNVIGSGRSRVLARPLKMLILADPQGDLKGANEEGKQLCDRIDKDKELINVSMRTTDITVQQIMEKIRNFDLVHFAGHADYDIEDPDQSGWRLSDGSFKADDIIKMSGSHAMPSFIFANACQSARTEEWTIKKHFQDEIFGLANAFVLAGVRHYVGTFWEVLDEPSRRFAMEYYQQMLAGGTVGEAMLQARLALIREYGEETIVWASYMLYGDPTFNYIDEILGLEEPEDAEVKTVSLPESGTRAGKVSKGKGSEQAAKSKMSQILAVAAGVLLLAGIVFWWMTGTGKKQGASVQGPTITAQLSEEQRLGKNILTAYQAGKFDEALQLIRTMKSKYPEKGLPYVIEGDIAIRDGKLDEAKAAYQKAVEAVQANGPERSRALVGLGRLASIENKVDQALDYYRQASEAAPGNSMAYMAQALLLDANGDSGQALEMMEKAGRLAPHDQVMAAIAEETRKKMALANDREKQERIDKLVNELVANINRPARALTGDGWTSGPLTLWIMDPEVEGYSVQEGEDRLLTAGVTELLLQHGRVQLVERALIDKLLGELKLGTSDLVNRNTALSLGRMLAAKLMLTGHIVYNGPQTQVALRLIEIETGRITASVSELFGAATPVSLMSQKLTEDMEVKLADKYPIRGKIAQIEGEDITLNIGQNAGVMTGDRFKVGDGVSTLEIIAAQGDSSLAKVVDGEMQLVAKLRVQKY